MANDIPLRSTRDLPPQFFRHHGSVDIDLQGRILVTHATGPFNRELLESLVQMALSTYPSIAAGGPWGQYVVFHESALASMDVVQGLTEGLRRLVAASIAPPLTAYCIPPEVEGALFMGGVYARAFADAGLQFQTFASPEAGRQWIETTLAASPTA